MAIGGARECLFVEPGLLNIILDRRMGFIRVAMETGEPIVCTWLDCFKYDTNLA
jgi:Diacylglycerol acyltransferase